MGTYGGFLKNYITSQNKGQSNKFNTQKSNDYSIKMIKGKPYEG